VRRVTDAEVPDVYAARSAPDRWLVSSGIAQSSDPSIAATANGLVTTGMSPLDRMMHILTWTSTSIGGGIPQGLDAKTVFDTRIASCTGYTNIAMAMGRAVGVPTRHVTNILAIGAQDMHSIDEFYLGPALGWRRVEPQGTLPRVPDDYGFIMRLVLPEDESPTPNRPSPGGPLMSGIPLHEFPEIESGAEGITPLETFAPRFTDCSFCPSSAVPQADLRDVSADQMKSLFASARAHWQADLTEYAAGGLSSGKMTARRKALDAKTASDVTAILSAL
jgi:hypothetical protein